MKLGRQWDERLKIWDEAFEDNLYTRLGEISLSGFTTMAHLSLEQAAGQDFQPFPVGTGWGAKWEYGWFRGEVTLPGEAAGKRILLHLGPGPEMLVFVNGVESGSIDRQHHYVELTACATPGEHFVVYAECYGGHGARREDGGIWGRTDVPVPEPVGPQCKVESSHYGIFQGEMAAVYADYHTLYDLWKAMPERDLRTMKIGEALQQFTYVADFETPWPQRIQGILEGDKLLRPLLEKKNGDTVPVYSTFGQSHLDLAWLWPQEETRRKAARTYSNQLALMERYPGYRFLLCGPTILEYLKADYPRLYGRVREKVRTGQFLPEGAVYVESDTNLPGGESLVRQFVMGKRWFQAEFGADSQVAWLPDTFGFTGALPQIMRECRVPYFATQKLLRCDPECEQFPYNLFWWEGIDGTRVLAHIYKKNNAVFGPGALRERWEKDRNQKQGIDTLLFPFGYGDGGGGPTELMVEMEQRCRDLEGAPRCTMESPAAFFHRLDQKAVSHVYYGELYLAWHRGTYTAQARIKRGVRKGEMALREAEYLAGLLRLTGQVQGQEETLGKIEELWKLLLVQEFHDILPGTSIERVNREAEEALERVRREGRHLAGELLCRLAGGRALFNSLNWQRHFRGLCLPSCGYVKLGEGAMVPEAHLRQESRCWRLGPEEELQFSNEYYRVRMNARGEICSLTDAATGYEYAQGMLNVWRLYRDVNVCYDAWELGRMYEQVPEALTGEVSFQAEQMGDGSMRAVLTRQEAYFTVEQKIYFAPDSPRIDFETQVDWRERHRILKVEFPTTVYTREAIEEIQFGYIRRPTHRSRQYEQDLYETCHHKYAVLTDGENGFALLNDCKYGLSAQDSRLSLTLLRAPVMPDMTADQGRQQFTYSILPFSGPFVRSRVIEEAYACNVDVTAAGFQAQKRGARMDPGAVQEVVSFFRLEGGHVVLETCKPAYDRADGVVLRLYESKGCAGQTTLLLPGCVGEVYACNMLEEVQEGLDLAGGRVRLGFRAFEIKTLLLVVSASADMSVS